MKLNVKQKKNLTLSKLHNSVNTIIYSGSQKDFEKIETSFSPNNFKRTLGGIKTQFQKFEANNFKGLILYLMQTIHMELNYFGGKPSTNLSQPNQYDKDDTFLEFINSYNSHNSSIISNIFYGTYEIITLCHKCYKPLYNYKKFEIITFDMLDYKNKIFDIYDGFEDNLKPQQLRELINFIVTFAKNLKKQK